MDPQSAHLPDMSAPPPTMAAALRARAADSAERVFLRAGEHAWTFAETYREACRFANLFLRAAWPGAPVPRRRADGQPARLRLRRARLRAGRARRWSGSIRPAPASALARDVEYADCQLVLVEARYAAQLREALAPIRAALPVLVVERPSDPPSAGRELDDALAAVDAPRSGGRGRARRLC